MLYSFAMGWGEASGCSSGDNIRHLEYGRLCEMNFPKHAGTAYFSLVRLAKTNTSTY